MDQARQAILYGLIAGPSVAALLGVWRKGWVYGFLCGLGTLLFMAMLLLPIYLGFANTMKLG